MRIIRIFSNILDDIPQKTLKKTIIPNYKSYLVHFKGENHKFEYKFFSLGFEPRFLQKLPVLMIQAPETFNQIN